MNAKSSAGLYGLVLSYCYGYWRQQRWLVPVMTTGMVLATLGEAIVPLFAGNLVDAVALGRPGADGALRAVLSIAATVLTISALRFTVFRLLVTSSTDIMRQMVDDAFHRVQRFATDWHASSFTGATVRKITRAMWAYDKLADTLLLGLMPSVLVLCAVTVLLALHWPVMGLIVMCGVAAVIAIATTFILTYLAPAARRSNATDSLIGATLADSIDGNPVVKSFASEAHEDGRLAAVTTEWQRRTVLTWNRYTTAGTTQSLTMTVLQVLVLLTGLWLWRAGRATPGDFAYLLATYTLIQGYLREISNHVRNLQTSVADMEDAALIQLTPLGVQDRPDATALRRGRGEIVFDHVSFRYDGQSHALYDDFSLTLKAGECVGLVGESGSGKSTFVKLIQRLYDLDSGRILIDGQDIATVTQTSLRAQIALVPQDPALFHRTLAENIGYGRRSASRSEIARAAGQARADRFIEALPLGYDTEVGERGVKLSGGERQRVALARAILSDAMILILDEATSSLDSISEALMQQAVETAIAGRTTIIVAHRLSTVQKADRILVFDRGRIVEQGPHRELLQRPDGYYRRLFESQALGLVGDGSAFEAA